MWRAVVLLTLALGAALAGAGAPVEEVVEVVDFDDVEVSDPQPDKAPGGPGEEAAAAAAAAEDEAGAVGEPAVEPLQEAAAGDDAVAPEEEEVIPPEELESAAAEAEADLATAGEGPVDPASELSFGERMACGSAARLVASVVLHPFDTMRTRAQARKRASIYARPSLLDVCTKGIIPQAVLSAPAGAVQFATLEYARDALGPLVTHTTAKNLLASALGAVAASVIRVPQEVRRAPPRANVGPAQPPPARRPVPAWSAGD